ncbi:Signal peptidase I [termite gut metagenome]|uniref:Signal peptidase I n=1 Tax=termite gut metagenome TaxID=433724 RepID=A0A5J4SI84_9ZZZZ
MAIFRAIAIVLLLHLFAFTSYYIPSSGMENTLFQGERVFVNKWSYGLRLPFMSFFSYHRWGEKQVERGDIVGFNNPANVLQPVIDRREIFISRCDGVPGDTLLVDSLFSVILSAKDCQVVFPYYRDKNTGIFYQNYSVCLQIR